MDQFHYEAEANSRLLERYPSAQELVQACRLLGTNMQLGVLRSFTTEGIPAAFQSVPLLYEAMRDFIAQRVGVLTSHITLIGSARLGYSLAPPPAYGRPFDDQSDLDLVICSDELFNKLVQTFNTWQEDVRAGREELRNVREERFWRANLADLPRSINRGFIDTYKLPNRYELTTTISQTLYLVREKLRLTPLAPIVRRVSARVYRDREAFFRQQHLNLRLTLARFR